MSVAQTFEDKSELAGKYAKVAARLPSGCTVLEIGCATGNFSRALMTRGHEVFGIEKNAEAAALARQNGVSVICCDIEDPTAFSALQRLFDVVLLMDVLEHLQDPGAVLKGVKSLLNCHGRVIITGPNVAYWAVRKDLLLGKWEYTDAGILDRTHRHFYTTATWERLVANAGYRINVREPAEGMIPLEHIWSKIPLLGRATPWLREQALRWSPALFTVVYLLEAVPIEQERTVFQRL